MLKTIFLSIILITTLAAQNIQYVSTFPDENSPRINNLIDFEVTINGDIIIADQNLKKLLIFNNSGEFLSQLPKEGSGFKFDIIKSISTDVNGNIWILDSGQNRIFSFDKEGNKIIEFGKSDGLRGALANPISLAVDAENNIYIVDLKLQKVLKYSDTGIFLGDVHVFNPISICTGGSNRIYALVSKSENDFYVLSFSPDLDDRNEIKISNLQEPISISLSKFDEIFIADRRQNKIFLYSPNGNIKNENIGNPSSSKGPGKFSNLSSVKVKNVNNEKDNIYAADGNFNYIQKFEINQLRDFVPAALNSSFTISNFRKLQLDEFEHFFYDDKYFFFYKNDKTLTVTEDEKTISVLNLKEIKNPSAAASIDNNVFVSDSREGRILIFSLSEDKIIKTITDNDVAGLSSPKSIVRFGEKIFVLDSESKQIFKFTGDGKYLGVALDLSFLNEPILLKSNQQNTIYVLQSNSNYVFEFLPNKSKTNQIRLPFGKEKFVSDLTVVNDQIIAFVVAPDLNVMLLKNYMEEFSFLSKGNSLSEIPDISKIFFNSKTKEILFVDNNSKSVYAIEIKLKDDEILEYKINDLGYAELVIKSDSNKGNQIQLFKKKSGSENFEFIKSISDTSFVIFEDSNELVEYAIKIGESGFSNIIEDNFTFAKSMKQTSPYKAISILQNIVDINPAIVKSEIKSIYKSEIDNAKKEEKYNNALKLLAELQKLDSENYVIYIEKSELYEKINQINNAVREIETAVDNFPQIPSLVYRLIDLKRYEKKYDEIVIIAERSLQRFSQDEILFSYLAEANKNLNRSDEAVRYYRMLAQRYNSEDYYIKLADIYEESGNYTEAIKVYEEIKNKGLGTSGLYAATASMHIKQNQTEKALEQINQGLSIDEKNPELYYLLASVQFLSGNLSEAEKSINKAIELNDNSASYYILLGDIHNQNGNIDESVYNYESAVLIASDNVEVLKKLGMIYLDENKIDYAYKHLTKAKSIDPKNEEIIKIFNTVESQREELNAQRESIEFNYIEVGEVSAQKLDYYNNNYFGSVTLFNTRNFPIKNCVIEISSFKLSAKTVFINVELINPNEYSENYFDFQIDGELFEAIPMGTSVIPMDFTVRYNLIINGENISKTNKTSVEIKITN